MLYRQDLVELGRWEPTRSEFDDEQLYRVNKHQFAKFSLDVGGRRETLVLVNLHLRARADKADLRLRQARQLNRWMTRLTPAERRQLIVLGDFNTEQVAGQRSESTTEVDLIRSLGTGTTDDDLFDLHIRLPQNSRATHLTGGQFDRMLIGPGLLEDGAGRDLSWQAVRVDKNACVRGLPDKQHWDPQPYWSIPAAERDISDHYPLVATFQIK